MTTASRVLNAIEKHSGIAKGTVTLTDNFIDNIGYDSLDCVEILMIMEKEFSIEIDEYKCESISFTVGDAVRLIDSTLTPEGK